MEIVGLVAVIIVGLVITGIVVGFFAMVRHYS